MLGEASAPKKIESWCYGKHSCKVGWIKRSGCTCNWDICWKYFKLMVITLKKLSNNTCCESLCKPLKCPYRQNFYFPIWSYIPCNELWRKKFSIWILSDFSMKFYKPENPILLRSTRAADHIIDVLRFVT